jgi:hypothetical protein
MIADSQGFLPLFTEQGELHGVFVSAEMWRQIEPALQPFLKPKRKAQSPEPLEDWEQLLSYWDFKYPVNREVTCALCGAHTDNWEEDDPRVFRLKTANLGGYVRFKCCGCGADITKRHFKSHIETKCQACELKE